MASTMEMKLGEVAQRIRELRVILGISVEEAAEKTGFSVEKYQAAIKKIKDAGCKLYFVACGTEDFLYDTSNKLDAALTEIGFPHTYYVTGGGHTWANWRDYLNTLAPLLFK